MDSSAAFDITFPEDTELSAPIALCLWIEARTEEGRAVPHDMILCCFRDKRARQGRSLRFGGSVGTIGHIVTRGYIRVSRRALD